MNNKCENHGWNNTENEPCPYCIIDQLHIELMDIRFKLMLTEPIKPKSQTVSKVDGYGYIITDMF